MLISCWNCHQTFDIVKAILYNWYESNEDRVECPHCNAVHAGSDIPAQAVTMAENSPE